MAVADNVVVAELVMTPVKLLTELTRIIYESPTGSDAFQEAVNVVSAEPVKANPVGALAAFVVVLPRGT